MRARWKILGGATVTAAGMVVIILGHSRDVSGDTSSSTAPAASSAGSFADPAARDPFAQYPTPGAITYEQLGAADQAAVDHIQEVTDTSQPAASHAAFASATAWTIADAERQIAARAVGLTDTTDDGVVP